jgi:hypothetical protein
VHAIGRRTGDVVDARLGLEYPQGYVQRQRITRAATITIRGHDRNLGEGQQGLPEAADALRTEAVIVADQDFQAVRVFKCIAPNIAWGLEPIKGASLYCFVSISRR